MTDQPADDKINVITLAPLPRQRTDDDGVRDFKPASAAAPWAVVEQTVKAGELTNQINILLTQIEVALKDTHSTVGPFHFSEFEISAGMTATGKLALFTIVGAEAGVSGGLKFVFRRSPES